MSHRFVSCVVVFTFLSACVSSAPDTATAPAETPTSSPGPTIAPQELQYGYSPGTTLSYDLMVTQDITFSADGDAPAFGEATLPIDADLVTESDGRTDYAITAGPSAGTHEIAITARFPETRVAGTVNGETVDNLEEGGVEADLARIEPVDVTVVADAYGRIVDDGEEAASVLGADLAALTGLTNDLFAVPAGPPLVPGRAVSVGDVWETTFSHTGQSGPVAAHSVSEVIEVADGTLVIETTTTTDAYTVDFSDEFRELFREFARLEADGELPPDVTDRLDAIRFVISVDESTTVEVAEFDPAAGLIRASTKTAAMRLAMTFRAPDEAAEDSGFEIILDLSQTAVFTLGE